MKKVLIVDDDHNICDLLQSFLKKKGFESDVAFNAVEGLKKIQDQDIDLVISDFRLPDFDGIEFLQKIKAYDSAMPVIIITGYSDIRIAVKAMKYGAHDYVTKPLYPDELLSVIKEAIEKAGEKQTPQTAEDKKSGSDNPSVSTRPEFVVGDSRHAKKIMEEISVIAPTDMSVILLGETGTGKEFIAREIHFNSKRSDNPFVAIDCGALPKDIAGSELFGHEKGAFTGAVNSKDGQFKHADGGTLFLDEIGNLSYEVQIKLLRVLQERKFKKLGGDKDITVDIRIVTATNEDLKHAVAEGDFREDLYHRLNEYNIQVAPLRHRREDILKFAGHFIRLANEDLDREVKSMSDGYKRALLKYSWPGNIRELRNVIKRSVLVCHSEQLTNEQLPFEILHEQPATTEKTDSMDLKAVTESKEKELILNALQETGNNKSKAADILKIDRKTLYNKMKAYGMD